MRSETSLMTKLTAPVRLHLESDPTTKKPWNDYIGLHTCSDGVQGRVSGESMRTLQKACLDLSSHFLRSLSFAAQVCHGIS